MRIGGQLLLLLVPPFTLRRVEVLPALLFPILSVSTACIGFRFGSAASFHFPGNVGLGLRTSDWQQQQDKPLPGLLMKQISLFVKLRSRRVSFNKYSREKERRQEVTPPVARTRRARGEVSDDDEGDDDDDANRVGAGAAA